MPDYAKTAQKAEALIAKFGSDCTIISKRDRVVDKIEGTVVEGPETRSEAKIAFFPATSSTINSFEKRLREDFVTGRARYAICSAVGIVDPKIGDLVDAVGETYSVIGITPLAVTSTSILHNLGLRKV